MPYIDYFLTSDTDLTKDKLTESELTRSLTANLDLGKDNRTWSKSHLNALKLLLCNAVTHVNQDNNIYIYSRKKKTIPARFNPNEVGYRSLFYVIDKLVEAKILEGFIAQPRSKGNNPKQLSEFTVTQHFIDLAISLGINRQTVSTIAKFHVRLRDTLTDENLEFKDNEYTKHVEHQMSEYCYYLNAHNILLSTENYDLDTGKGITDYGLRGQPIHLYRNYRNYSDHKDYQEDLGKLFNDSGVDINFLLGGRSGGYWQGSKEQHTEDRDYILIDGKKTKKADFPCSHTNLCYREETGHWYQTETHEELLEEGRELEDAYVVAGVPRKISKHMMMLMLNCKGRRAVSNVFNSWIEQKNDDDSDNATDEQVALYNKHVKDKYTNVEIMKLLEAKHKPIKDYLYKGKLGGQIIQWVEANLMHHLAVYFQQAYNIPILTVYDELITWEEEQPMIKDFMFSTTDDELCSRLSLMKQIKNL